MQKDKEELLNKIVKDNLTDNVYDIYRLLMEEYEPILEAIYLNEYYDDSKKEEVNLFSINKTIDICYSYLKTFDEELAERFLNILQVVDENNKPYVNFIINGSEEDNRLDEDHKVYIYIENTARDARSLIHEIFHKFNEVTLLIDDSTCYSLTNRTFTETVSVLAESLLIDYMYTLGYINDYEYTMLKNERIENSKLATKILIIEKKLLEIIKNGKKITNKEFKLFTKRDEISSVKKKLIKDEIKNNTIINNICSKEYMEYPNAIGYVLAQYYTELFSEQDDCFDILVELNELISNKDTKINEVVNDFMYKRLVK